MTSPLWMNTGLNPLVLSGYSSGTEDYFAWSATVRQPELIDIRRLRAS